MSNDPTMALVESLKRDDRKDWGRIIDGVPIFVAHRWYERVVEGGVKEAKTVLYGEPALDAKDGWKLVYEITDEDLDTVCEETNKLFETHAKPMKLLLGHTRPGHPQESQPQIIGFGTNARMGTFGPKKIRAVVAKHYYRKGFEDVAAEYPERSPEFKQSTKVITGVAMLKTDPRLPMGMHAYEQKDDIFLYGTGYMADEPKQDDKPQNQAPATPASSETPSATPAAAMGPLEPLDEHEIDFANRLFNHYGCSPETMKYLGEQHKQYAASQSAMASASPTNGRTPATPIGAEKSTEAPKPQDEEHMMDAEEKRLYEEQIAFVMHENATLYADREYVKMVNLGVKKSLLGKFKERLVKLRTENKDNKARDAACNEYLEEVKNNYARESRPPIGRDFLPIPHETEAAVNSGGHGLDVNDPETVAAITRYAEVNKIDLVNDDDGWQKSLDGFAAAQNKKAARQTA